ncbi:hypothetical protein I3760_03G112600 [Carya illinoinensis]|nr:hypothetical protein I3760_03G112600 [Carya illinoinensis]
MGTNTGLENDRFGIVLSSQLQILPSLPLLSSQAPYRSLSLFYLFYLLQSLASDHIKKGLLPQSPKSEHFSDEIDVPICGINPKSVKFHNVVVLQRLKEINFTV